MRRLLVLIGVGCGAAQPPPASPVQATPVPVTVIQEQQPEAAPPPPAPAPAPAPPKAPVVAGPCNGRKATFALARATGLGSYVTTLACGENGLFSVVSDRATPDGREVKQAFEVKPLAWEKAWRALDDMGWRTLDDRCSAEERARGRGEGPVYRITIEDTRDKRTFICAGLRELTAPLDAVQTELALLAPPAANDRPPFNMIIGVPECDEYLARYKKCVNSKVPAAQRQGFLDAIDLTQRGLHETLMRDPDSGPALANQCKEMLGAARAAMKGFKCQL
jgi:hypothetical protein